MSKGRLRTDLVDLTSGQSVTAEDDIDLVDVATVDVAVDGIDLVDLEIVDASPETQQHPPSPWTPPTNWRYQGWRRLAKRSFDVAGSFVLIIALLPVLAVIAVAVRLSSQGPVLFAQERIGLHGQSFRMLKFRTMHVDADRRLRADEELWAEYVAHDYKLPPESDPRLISIGDWLRKTSLDELPQLFNVLRGTMSLVGPRPVVVPEFDHYRRTDSYQWLKPGATGPWQVSGRCTVNYPERSDIVDAYADSWSLTEDVKILLRTIPTILSRRGAY